MADLPDEMICYTDCDGPHVVHGFLEPPIRAKFSPATARKIARHLEKYALLAEAFHEDGIAGSKLDTPQIPPAEATGKHPCCWKCTPDYHFMLLCPTCGNKRCPHASDHTLACSGSNEVGQPGSIYKAPDAKAAP